MADEISISVRLSVDKGGARDRRSESVTDDMTDEAFVHGTQTITTSESELAQPTGLGTPGYLFIKCATTTSGYYVELGTTTGVYTVRVKAGKVALYYHTGATIYIKSTGGDCLVDYLLLEA